MARPRAERGTPEGERQRRTRRAMLSGGFTAVCLGGGIVATQDFGSAPWWLVVPLTALSGAFAGWAGAPTGRETGQPNSTRSPSSPLMTKFGFRPGSVARVSVGAFRSRAVMEAASSIRARGAPMQ